MKNDAGQRLDRFLAKAFPALPAGLAAKYIRLKRVKVNGKRAEVAYRLAEGDTLSLYVNDELLLRPGDEMLFRAAKPKLNVVYEDENVLLLDKEPGLSVHEDERSGADTLINRVKAYLCGSGEWDPEAEASFAPALCNRIDRNTGGIVIAAKNAESLRILNEKLRDRQLEKRYLCLVHGTPEPAEGRLTAYLTKHADENIVSVSPRPTPGAKTAVTEYRVIKSRDGLSLVECRLITGRTHQIRAQLAAAGYPLFGDTKYGKRSLSAQYTPKREIQALYSYKLTFAFRTDAGILSYLDGKTFRVADVDFERQFLSGEIKLEKNGE